jgi:hypothetical protein
MVVRATWAIGPIDITAMAIGPTVMGIAGAISAKRTCGSPIWMRELVSGLITLQKRVSWAGLCRRAPTEADAYFFSVRGMGAARSLQQLPLNQLATIHS